jgi:DNA-binding transcriptional LysR family regulator
MKTSDRIGRRMKLHDLHVLMSVVQAGSMGRAASVLNTTQSAISRSITELEHAVGVRLLDRSRQGVEPTEYGRALLDGGAAVFDDLRQAVKNIEFLADPTTGHVTIAGSESTTAALLPAVFGGLRRRHPGLSMHVVPAISVAQQYRELRERRADLVIGRLPSSVDTDIEAEVLYHERLVVVAGPGSKWLRHRKIALPDLANEPWLLPPPDTLVASLVADGFRSHAMEFPPKGAATGAIHLLFALLASGPFLLAMSGSLLQLGTHLPPLKILPVDFPSPPWPVGIMTLKHRTRSPVTRLFIEHAREVAKPLAARHRSVGRARNVSVRNSQTA